MAMGLLLASATGVLPTALSFANLAGSPATFSSRCGAARAAVDD
jgi:hypothetical protein